MKDLKTEVHQFVKVEDLKIGDEIMVPSSSRILCLIVLREPKLSKVRKSWTDKSKMLYVATLCSYAVKMTTVSYNSYNRTYEEYDNTFENHNREKRFDLNYSDIYLVRRKIENL